MGRRCSFLFSVPSLLVPISHNFKFRLQTRVPGHGILWKKEQTSDVFLSFSSAFLPRCTEDFLRSATNRIRTIHILSRCDGSRTYKTSDTSPSGRELCRCFSLPATRLCTYTSYNRSRRLVNRSNRRVTADNRESDNRIRRSNSHCNLCDICRKFAHRRATDTAEAPCYTRRFRSRIRRV